MSALTRFAQRFQSIENLAPRAWRLPLRYHGQKLVGGLEPEMALLERLVPKDHIALDIGANHGIYAYALSRLAQCVHAFEPLAECCRYIQDHHATTITVHNVALSDHPGTLRLYVPVLAGRAVYTRASLDCPDGPCDSRSVKVRALDSYGLDNVGFVKIDVEGLEAAVLRGASATLTSQHPNLLVEVDRAHHSRESFLAVFGQLEDLGYQAHICEHSQLTACSDPWGESLRRVNFVFI
jgi:FkbM family methyltransferase